MYGPANISGTSSHRETSNMRAGGGRERKREGEMDIERGRQSGQSTYSKHTDIITSSLKAMTFNLTNVKLPFLPFHHKKI